MIFSAIKQSLNQNGVSFNRLHAYLIPWAMTTTGKTGLSRPCAGTQYSFGLGPPCSLKACIWHSTVLLMMLTHY